MRADHSLYSKPIGLFALLLCACSGTRIPPSGSSDAGTSGPQDSGVSSDAGVHPDATTIARIPISVSPDPPVAFGACDTQNAWPEGWPQPALGLECAQLDVPVDHAVPTGPKVAIRVARHRATNETGRALFQLAGGPGGGAVSQSTMMPRVLSRARERYDLVYVDQRGTGGSGYLDCAAGYPETENDWRACAAEHSVVPKNHFLTVDAAHDIEWVRQRLGYSRIALRGGSYGTRVGLEYLRQHDGTYVESAVLDGLFTVETPFFRTFIVNFDRGVERLGQDCAQSDACRTITSSIVEELAARRARLRVTPRRIRVNGRPYNEDEETYRAAVHDALMDAAYRFRIPRAIHNAETGSNTLWNGVLGAMYGVNITDDNGIVEPDDRPAFRPSRRPRVGQTSYVAPGVFAIVTCGENVGLEPDLSALETLVAAQTWGDDHVLQIYRACSTWSVEPMDPLLRSPVVSNTKVLLLNGELDLNTFAEEGARAAATLPNATNLIVPHATHSTLQVPCAANIANEYLLAEGNIANVDTSCLSSLTHPDW